MTVAKNSYRDHKDENARIYPCADCGKLRSRAEGGTTFTVCDSCWDKHWKRDGSRDATRSET